MLAQRNLIQNVLLNAVLKHPQWVNKKLKFGHWKADVVESKQGIKRQVLLVLLCYQQHSS